MMDDEEVSEATQFHILAVGENANELVAVKQAFSEEASCHDFETAPYELQDEVELLAYLDRCGSGEGFSAPNPHLIAINMKMPVGGGRELLHKVISHSLGKRTPIIVFATSDDQTDVIECYRCGGASFSRKPYSRETLKQVVQVIVHYWLFPDQLPVCAPCSCMGYG